MSGRVLSRAVALDGTAVPRPLAWRLSALGLGATCAGSALLVLHVTQHEWFHSDEWDLLTTRVGPDPVRSIWLPHNEHPVMIPTLVWRALFDAVGIRSYLPYMLPLIAVHLALVVVVWCAARRAGAGPVATTGAASTLAFCGAGQQNMLSAFQLTFVGSLLATWCAALLADHPRPSLSGRKERWPRRPWLRLALLWLVLAAGLCCSLVSLPLLVLPGSVAWVRRGLRAAVVATAVPLAGFGVWFDLFGRRSAASHPKLAPAGAPAYVAHGLVSIFGAPIGLAGSGVVALGGLVLAAGWRLRRVGRWAPELLAFLGLPAVCVYFAFASVGRTDLGTVQAGTSRYVYVGVALVIPACACLASEGTNWVHGRSGGLRSLVAALTVAAGILAVGGIDARGALLLERERVPITNEAEGAEGQFGTALRLLHSGQGLLSAASVNPGPGAVYAASVLRLDSLRAFGILPAEDLATQAEAELRLQVALVPSFSTSSTHPSPLTVAVGLSGASPVPRRPLQLVTVVSGLATPAGPAGCLRIAVRGGRATAVLRTPVGGGQDLVHLLHPGRSGIGLKTGLAGPGIAKSRPAGLVDSVQYWLVSTATTARVLLTFTQPIDLCSPVAR